MLFDISLAVNYFFTLVDLQLLLDDTKSMIRGADLSKALESLVTVDDFSVSVFFFWPVSPLCALLFFPLCLLCLVLLEAISSSSHAPSVSIQDMMEKFRSQSGELEANSLRAEVDTLSLMNVLHLLVHPIPVILTVLCPG